MSDRRGRGRAETAPACDLIDDSAPLAEQNAKLRRITRSLMRRVEQDTAQAGNAYTLFQRSIALEGELRARTQDLERTLAALTLANERLEAATAEADAANRAKSRFLAAASHDLLQPLNAAKLFLSSLTDTGLSAAQARIVDNLDSAFTSVDALIGSLLEISKLDAANPPTMIAPFPIATVLDVVIREFEPIAAAKGLELRQTPCSAHVLSDRTYLRQIVQNLISNAVRYTESGRVSIGCRRRGDQLRIDVLDTGPGVPADQVEEIFREFRRLAPAAPRADAPQGVGLGLAIVERACRLLGHDVMLRPAPGGGACFSVLLPLVEAHDGPPPPQQLGGDLFLVMSDDAALRAGLTTLLESWDVSVIAVANAAEAIEQIQQLGVPPDLAVLDRAGLDADDAGYLTRRLRMSLGVDVPAIWIAGEAESRAAAGARTGEAVVYRPLKAHQLRAMLSWRLADARDA